MTRCFGQVEAKGASPLELGPSQRNPPPVGRSCTSSAPPLAVISVTEAVLQAFPKAGRPTHQGTRLATIPVPKRASSHWFWRESATPAAHLYEYEQDGGLV